MDLFLNVNENSFFTRAPPPQTGGGENSQKKKGGLSKRTYFFVVLIFVVFLFVFFARYYSGEKEMVFWKKNKDFLVAKMKSMLYLSEEKAKKVWDAFWKSKIFTLIGRVVRESKQNIGTIIRFIKEKGMYLYALLFGSRIDVDKVKRELNPFEVFGLDPFHYDYEKMKKQIHATKSDNPRLQKVYEEIGSELISSKERFEEERNRFITVPQGKRKVIRYDHILFSILGLSYAIIRVLQLNNKNKTNEFIRAPTRVL